MSKCVSYKRRVLFLQNRIVDILIKFRAPVFRFQFWKYHSNAVLEDCRNNRIGKHSIGQFIRGTEVLLVSQDIDIERGLGIIYELDIALLGIRYFKIRDDLKIVLRPFR